MLKSERKQLILEQLATKTYVTLEELVTLLDTSESTVRRDLDELESERRLRRVHGGAESLQSSQAELTIQQKSIKNIQEKKSLVEKASQLIQNEDVIFLDAGSTIDLLIDFLNQEKITVVTNSIHHATRLVDKGIRTLVIGGFVKPSTDVNIGMMAREQIEALNFDKAFLGINGIDEQYLTTPGMEEAELKRAVIANAKQTYVLADASKIGQVFFTKVARIESVQLVTNVSETRMLEKIKQKTKVIEV